VENLPPGLGKARDQAGELWVSAAKRVAKEAPELEDQVNVGPKIRLATLAGRLEA